MVTQQPDDEKKPKSIYTLAYDTKLAEKKGIKLTPREDMERMKYKGFSMSEPNAKGIITITSPMAIPIPKPPDYLDLIDWTDHPDNATIPNDTEKG